jgi:hypothetical protein
MKRAKALRHATRFIILMISFEAEFAVRRIQLCAVTVTKVYMGDISLKKNRFIHPHHQALEDYLRSKPDEPDVSLMVFSPLV